MPPEITLEQMAQGRAEVLARLEALPFTPAPRSRRTKAVVVEPVVESPIEPVAPTPEPKTGWKPQIPSPEAPLYVPDPVVEPEPEQSGSPVIHLRPPHPRQADFIDSKAKRIIIRAGRRGGKTLGVAIKALLAFLSGKRVLYAAPTSEQSDRFWYEVTTALAEAIRMKAYVLNKSERFIERPGTLNRIKAKTAWDADSLRGDYADLLILDEWQLTNEDAWEIVGAPMLMDNNGDAVFIYTPTSLRSAGVSKAHDPRHAAKMFKLAGEDLSGRWARFHFTSFDNPYLSREGLVEVTRDMSQAAIRQEIMAEDDELSANHLVYGVWNEKLHKIPRFEVPMDWPIWSGHDFGTANPAALFWARVKLPLPKGAPLTLRANDLVVFREYLPGAGKSTALNVEAFQDLTRGRRVVGSAGGSHQEEEIRQGYRKHGWNIQEPTIVGLRPQVDRVLSVMEADRWNVFDDCVYYLAELASCTWQYDKEGIRTNDIKNEARMHLCFVQGTMVQTINGEKPIESISPSDLVATRQGYHPVVACGMTQVTDTVEVHFSDGSRLRGTRDHPVWLRGYGFRRLSSVRYGDRIETWKERQLSTEEQSTIGTHRRSDDVIGSISSLRRGRSTVLCGKMLTVRYLQDALSTIGIMTQRIMNYLTLSARAMESTWQTIWWGSPLMLSAFTQNRQRQGVGLSGYHPKVERYSRKKHGRKQRIDLLKNGAVTSVENHICTNPLLLAGSVPTSASLHTAVHQAPIMRQESASRAGKSLRSADTKVPGLAPVYVVRLTEHDKSIVYNLTVDAVHEYYANGILVSNCSAARYGLSFSDFTPETVWHEGEAKIYDPRKVGKKEGDIIVADYRRST